MSVRIRVSEGALLLVSVHANDEGVAKRRAPGKQARVRRGAALDGLSRVRGWFAEKGWKPWAFQEEAWGAYLRGESGLIQVATGAGKTYGAFLGALAEMLDLSRDGVLPDGIHTLYISPLRAVTRDVEHAIREPVRALGARVRVGSRTGDTSAGERARQQARLPHVLITTPESLCLLLTREHARGLFAGLRCVIVDEWHELLISKRGSALELALARLRAWNPALRTWGMSATLPNAAEAMEMLCGATGQTPTQTQARTLVRAEVRRPVTIRAVVPRDLARLPWAGHLGLSMLPDVLGELDPAEATLIFVNARSQAERWFHAIQFARPEWAGLMALHHGSVEREERERVEAGLKDGSVRLVVATSSLDLGVDFSPVQKVLQIGSPKGIARIVQRAGRANHYMGGASVVSCVPTHAMELLEVAAARGAFEAGLLEERGAYDRPLDVLAQHIVTCALGGGFREDELFEEVRGAWSYRGLSRAEFDWTLALVREGGVLKHYPQFRRVARAEDGLYRGTSAKLAAIHRLNVGTITSGSSLQVRYVSGRALGSIDEGFVSGLRENEKFVFAGKVVRFLGVHGLDVLVRAATGKTSNAPIWGGTRLPISESLSHAMRETMERVGAWVEGERAGELPREFPAVAELVRTQMKLSRVPRADELLAEVHTTREGTHLFVFPFEGRLVNAGVGALLALRLARVAKEVRGSGATLSFTANDYGAEVLCAQAFPFEELLTRGIFSLEGLEADVAASINMSQLARLAFRDVARVAGLVVQNQFGGRGRAGGGGGRTGKHIQANSGLIFDVLQDFDPENLLLAQARKEVLERHFERSRLGRTLERLQAAKLVLTSPGRLTPLSFPLVIERSAGAMSTQTLAERVEEMRAQWGRERE